MEVVIKHYIETLNRENGGSLFEFIASSLAEKEICSNIMPSTGPYGGGDKGVDSRTHKTYLLDSNDNFRLYFSTDKSPTKKRIIFAFSIQKDWELKLDKDCKKIIETNKLGPDEVRFMTNQFVKTKTREEKTKELKKRYPKVDFEIHDGNWVANLLKERHYNLLVRYCGFPETHDPKIEEIYLRIYSFREGGMTDEESVRVKELLERANYRSSYDGILEQRVIDLRTVANIKAQYTAFIEDSIKLYEEALTEVKEVSDAGLISGVYYDYFRALQKLRLFDRIANKLLEYRNYLLENKRYQDYRFVFSWLVYLLPHQTEVSSIDLKTFAKESYKLIQKDQPQKVARHITAYYKEALVQGNQLFIFLGKRKDDSIILWKSHINQCKDIPLYPISKVARIVTALAIPYEGTPEYEELYNFVESILLSRNQKLDAAQLRKDRGVNLFHAGKYDQAIRHFNIVKVQWYDYETIRGSMLSAWILNECYSKLRLYYAALQELFSILHLTTLDEDTFAKHRDLFVQSLAFIYYKYLQLGLFGSAMIMGKLTLYAIAKYREEPKLGDGKISFEETYRKNTGLSLVSLNNKFGEYTDRLLSVIENVDAQAVMTYKMFFKETDEEFEQGWEGAEDKLVDAKKLRKELRQGKYADLKNDDIAEPVDESAKLQKRSFVYKDMECSVDFTNGFDAKRLVEHLLAYLQASFVFFLEDQDLAWIENQLIMHIVLDESASRFQIRERPNNDAVEFDLVVSSKIVGELFTIPFKELFELERLLFSYILMQCTIDKKADIESFIKKLNEKGFFEGLSGRVPFGYTIATFFPDEDYQKLLD